jgi:ATP-binding cassette subfamily C (CFTR/MRP) protein 4
MLTKLCLCPVSFFDTNPSGRILNRFSTDLSLADNEVVKMFWDIEELVIFFLFSLITIIILQPWFIFAVVPTILANLWILNLSKTMISQAKV